MGVDVDLEVIGHLALNAVPFVELLQLCRLVSGLRLLHLAVLRQPVPEGLPYQNTGQRLWQFLQLPLGWCILGVLACRRGAHALPVIGRAYLRPRRPRVVDVLAGNVGGSGTEHIAAVIVRGTAVEQVDRVGRIGVVRDVAIRPHEATSRGNHLEPFRRHHEALGTGVADHCGVVHPCLEEDINHLLASLIVRYDELVGADIRLLHHQVAPEVHALGDVACVRDRAAIRRYANGVGEAGASGAAGKRDRAEEEAVRALLDVGGRDVGLRAHRASLHVEERAEAGGAVINHQLDVAAAIRTGVHGRLVLRARESGDALRDLVLPVSDRFQQFTGCGAVVSGVGDGISRYRDIRGRPVRRLADIVGVGQQVTRKPCLTPNGQVGPITGAPDLPYIRVKQGIEAFRSLRGQPASRDSNKPAKLG